MRRLTWSGVHSLFTGTPRQRIRPHDLDDEHDQAEEALRDARAELKSLDRDHELGAIRLRAEIKLLELRDSWAPWTQSESPNATITPHADGALPAGSNLTAIVLQSRAALDHYPRWL